MGKTIITIEQTGSPIRRHRSQRATLIGLGLNRTHRVAEVTDTPAIRGMIAKVSHLVRIVHTATELDFFIEAVRAEYHQVVAGPASRIARGGALWQRFEATVATCRADPNANEAPVMECVNELAIAKLLAEDPTIAGAITYEPDFLPGGRKIDFVVDRGEDNIYVEVKTVRPRTADTDEAWEKFQKRKQFHPQERPLHRRPGVDGRSNLRKHLRGTFALPSVRAGIRGATSGSESDQARTGNIDLLRE